MGFRPTALADIPYWKARGILAADTLPAVAGLGRPLFHAGGAAAGGGGTGATGAVAGAAGHAAGAGQKRTGEEPASFDAKRR